MEDDIPTITTVFDSLGSDPLSLAVIRKALKKILPLNMLRRKDGDVRFSDDQKKQFRSALPIVKMSSCPPAHLAFSILSKHRPYAFKFYYEIVSRGLVHGTRDDAAMVSAVDFHMPEISPDLYTLCEFILPIDPEEDVELRQRKLSLIETEIRIGLESEYQVNGILELKEEKKTTPPTPLMHPIFMPRNEEEIMRNLVSLSEQIKYLNDMPQVTISFDEQTHSSLFFTVILVYVTQPGALKIDTPIWYYKSDFVYLFDRTKNLGPLRKQHYKEALIFQVQQPKEMFLRSDQSIDLYKARQAIFHELERLLERELRDFNGGMISKQNEHLNCLKKLMRAESYNEILLENFFYSLTPVVMRTVLEPESLRLLFLMQAEMIESGFFMNEGYTLKIKNDSKFVYVMIKAEEKTVKEELDNMFLKLQIPSSDLANSCVMIEKIPYVGYLYRCDEGEKQRQFCQIVHNSILAWDTQRLASIQCKASHLMLS